MQYLKALKKCPLFKGIRDSDFSSMLQCMDSRTLYYQKNQPVFSEGEPADYVGIVLSGEIHIIKIDFDGNRNIIGTVTPSQLFGEVFACAGISSLPVSAIAASDSTVLLVSCKKIITTCSSSCLFHNQVIQNLLHIVAEKNLMLNQKIQFLSKKTTREKLMAFLYAQAKENQSTTFTIPYDRQALADYLGVERSAMSTELGKLKKEGKIDFHKNRFQIL